VILYDLKLTDEEILLLDGNCRQDTQNVVDLAKERVRMSQTVSYDESTISF
jgi:hypothetical protein